MRSLERCRKLVVVALIAAGLSGCAISATRSKAAKAMKEGRYDEAIEHYEAITKVRPFEKKWDIVLDEARRRAAIEHLGAARDRKSVV